MWRNPTRMIDAVEWINKSENRIKSHIPGLLLTLEGIPGDIAEFGVYEGWMCRGMAELQPHRTVWAFDTFEGMPVEDHIPGLDDSNPPGKWASDKSETIARLTAPNIRIMEGRFADTLPNCTATTFALVHIDCDTYNGYKQVLEWMVTRLANGAIVVMDDYPECAGAKKAVEEWKPLWEDHITWVGDMMFEWKQRGCDNSEREYSLYGRNFRERYPYQQLTTP